jgi:hypothetical protein
MNLRIQELTQQATQDIMGVPIVDQQKFAELIVAECCVALHPMLRDMISRTQGVDMIVKHFQDKE